MIDSAGTVIATFAPDWKLTALLPADGHMPYTEWTYSNPAPKLPSGSYTLAIHVVNPLPNGKSLKFANTTQGFTLVNWLTLGTIAVQ